jgi:hypothetical protein
MLPGPSRSRRQDQAAHSRSVLLTTASHAFFLCDLGNISAATSSSDSACVRDSAHHATGTGEWLQICFRNTRHVAIAGQGLCVTIANLSVAMIEVPRCLS